MFQLLDHGGDPSAENCMLFKTHDYIQGDILHAKKCYKSGQILVVDARLLGKDGRVHHTAEAAEGIRAIVLFEIREAPEVWVARVSGVPRIWAPLKVDALKDTSAYLEVPLGHYAKRMAKLQGYAAAYAARALNWIKQYPDVLKAPTDVQRKLWKSALGRNAIAKALLAKYEGKPLEDVPPTDLARIEKTMLGRNEITRFILAKYTSTSVQSILPQDLARLKSLNTNRAREVLSIKDADGHVQSFEHLVQIYFEMHPPSKRDIIEQWISNNWHTYFGNLKPLSQHQIQKQLAYWLTNGPYQYSRYGNIVYWARQDS